MSHSRRDTIIGWSLVAIQGLLIVGVVVVPRHPVWDGGRAVDATAWALIALGAILGAWGFVHLGSGLTPLPLPNGAVELITSGPYRMMRHPIYTAVMVGMSGIALTTRTPIAMAIAAGLIVFLNAKARWEERHLRIAFAGYQEYAHTTARFVPLRWPDRDRRPGSTTPDAR
jgi:protein-S-isoprenylcysteine O-methyltransferase Ste14